MKQRYWVYLAVLAFIGGYLLAQETVQPDVQTVVKEVKVREVVTVVDEHKREERRPDGTIIIETDKRTDKRSETQTDKDSAKIVRAPKQDWFVSVYLSPSKDALLTVNRRILGDLYLGVYGKTNVNNPADSSAGVGISYSF